MRRKIVYGLVGSLLSLLISLALGETALRIVDRPKAPIVGWKWRGNPEQANEFGFRGHRWTTPADITVLLLGDSQVQMLGDSQVQMLGDSQVQTSRPFHEMPEVFLAEILQQLTKRDIRIVSIGSDGWGQDQQLLALKKYLPEIKPRVVALWLTPGNDVWNNTFPTHFPKDGWPKPTFWLAGEELRGPHLPWMAPYHRQSLYLMRLVDRVRGIPPFVTDDAWESRLPPPYQSVLLHGQSAVSLRDFLAQRRGISPQEIPYFNDENFSNEKTHFSIALYPRSPRLAYSAKLTRLLLLEISKVCKANGAELLVFYTDTQYGLPDEPTDFEVAGRKITLSEASATALIDEILTDIPTLVITGLPEDSTVSKTDSHLNTVGNRYAMSELARWLVNTGFLPSSKPSRGVPG